MRDQAGKGAHLATIDTAGQPDGGATGQGASGVRKVRPPADGPGPEVTACVPLTDEEAERRFNEAFDRDPRAYRQYAWEAFRNYAWEDDG